jgi:glycosyltransferase involved in cell wall biosynthesis
MTLHCPAPVERPIRLLQIGKYFFPDQGGVETVTLAISQALAPHNVQADVLCFSRQPTYQEYAASFRVIRARTDFRLSNKSFSVDYVRQIAKLSSQYDVGLLHLPNPIGMLGALRFWNKPLLGYWHADITSYPLVGQLFRRYERRLIRRAARIIVPSPAHVFGSYLAPELSANSRVIPYPFDRHRLPKPDHSGPVAARSRQFAGARRMALAVGRLVPYKGFGILIAAARHLRPDLCVVICGTGPLRAALEADIVRHGVADKVLLLGSVNDADLASLYERARMVVMPSVTRAEMYGMTQVEAMSFGKPVVSTSIPGSGVSYVNRDGETGLIVRPGEVMDLANAMNQLVSDDELYHRLSAGALRAVHDTHDMSRPGEQLANVVREVVMQNATEVAAK